MLSYNRGGGWFKDYNCRLYNLEIVLINLFEAPPGAPFSPQKNLAINLADTWLLAYLYVSLRRSVNVGDIELAKFFLA